MTGLTRVRTRLYLLNDMHTLLRVMDSNLDRKLHVTWKNKLKVKNKTLAKQGIAADFPHVMHIELTSLCNLHCAMCPHDIMKREKMNMNFRLFKKITDQIPEKKVTNIGLYFFGEPLMYPKLIEAINYLKSKRLETTVWINTNAQLLTREMSKKLLSSKLDHIHFSINGTNKQQYESIHRSGSFDRVVENLRAYSELRKEMNSKQWATLVPLSTPDNSRWQNAYAKQWGRFIPHIVWISMHNKYITISNMPDEPHSDSKCGYPFFSMIVYSNGEVGFCCSDCDAQLSVGNAKNAPLLDLWRSKKSERIRRDYLKIPICRVCRTR